MVQKELGAGDGMDGWMERSQNLVVEGDEAHVDVGTLHTQRLDALQHGLLDKLESQQVFWLFGYFS